MTKTEVREGKAYFPSPQLGDANTLPCKNARWVPLSIALGLVILLVVALVSTTSGSVAIPPLAVLEMLLMRVPLVGPSLNVSPNWPPSYEVILFQMRLPRIVLAGLVGGSLALAGGTYQGLFRNPLADPYLIGVASGGALGATIAFVLPFGPFLYSLGIVQWLAFVTAALIVGAVYGLARVGGSAPVTTLILAGVALGSFASSVTSFLMFLNGDKLQAVYTWLLGGFTLSNWPQVLVTLPYTALGLGIICFHARSLNVLQLDEEQAAQLGIEVERLKLILIGAATLTTAAAVAVSGLIGFVGLIAPHAVRLVWGHDHRLILPLSALFGGAFLIAADTVARTVLAPGEVPVGVITAFLGAPFFLYLLRRQKREVF
ncbi:MAG: iron chelate uptake ABC transporter family permease subunit [Chloroflexi bacterium]|nr:iron chelate uptake ABC transporter family permease subunit [Chloroflexota bacterium]